MSRYPIHRRWQQENAGIIRDMVARAKWAGNHQECQFCGTTWNLQTHHIIGGVSGGRSDEPCNFLRVCEFHHDRCEGKIRVIRGVRYFPIPLSQQLWVKRECDSEEWNPTRLAQLNHAELPEPESLEDRYEYV